MTGALLPPLPDEIPVETLAGEFVVPKSREASDHTLIVVDDNEILRKVIGMHLEQAGRSGGWFRTDRSCRRRARG